FTVTLDHPSQQTIAVDYATVDGTAVAGSDYSATSGTLTFAPGVTSQQFTVNTTDDNIAEATETFFVNLTNASNATIANSQGIGTITDNDGTPTVQFSAATSSVSEGDTGTTPVTLTVNLSEPSASTVTVNYATADGTALAGSDYG